LLALGALVVVVKTLAHWSAGHGRRRQHGSRTEGDELIAPLADAPKPVHRLEHKIGDPILLILVPW